MARQVRRWGERRGFSTVLNSLESAAGLNELIERERAAITRASKDGTLNESYYTRSFHRERYDAPFDTELEDPLASFRYFEESCYSRILPRWDDALGKNLKVVVFERLIANSELVLDEICEFLQLGGGPIDLSLEKENVGRVPKNLVVRRILEFRSQNAIARRGVEAMKRVGLNRIIELIQPRLLWGNKPEFDIDLQLRVRKLLEPEYSYWFERDPDLRTLWDIPGDQSADLRSPNSDLRSE